MPKRDLIPPTSPEAVTLRLLGVRMIGSTFPRNWRMFLLCAAERGGKSVRLCGKGRYVKASSFVKVC